MLIQKEAPHWLEIVKVRLDWIQKERKSSRSMKWYFPSRIVLTKCVENLSKCNLIFFLSIKIEKHGVKNVFGPRPKAEGRNHSRLHVFQSRYSRKIIKFHEDWFSHTLSQNNAWRRMLFRIFWFFHTSLRSILPHFPLFPTFSPKFLLFSNLQYFSYVWVVLYDT